MASPLLFKVGWSGFSLIFVVVGLYTMNKGRELRGRSGRIADTEVSRVRDLQPGPVAVTGTARPAEAGSVMESPITAADALATRVTVEKYQGGEGSSWKTIHDEQSTVPLLVDDGTGEVRVELPTDGTLDVEQVRTRVGGGEEPPEPIRRYVEREAALDEAARRDLGLLSVGERRRYSEGVIEPGEEVYVQGTARDVAGWDGQGYVVDEPTPARDFVLSDKSEETLVREGKWGGGLLLAFGGLFTAVGTLFAVVPWVLV